MSGIKPARESVYKHAKKYVLCLQRSRLGRPNPAHYRGGRLLSTTDTNADEDDEADGGSS